MRNTLEVRKEDETQSVDAQIPPQLASRLRASTPTDPDLLRRSLLGSPLDDGPKRSASARDRAALMLHFIDSPQQLLGLTVEFLVDFLGTARGDAGFLCEHDDQYANTQSVCDPSAGAHDVRPISLPNHHPLLKDTWNAGKPVCFDRVRDDRRLGTLQPVFHELGTQAMMAIAVHHRGVGVAMVCVGETDHQRSWTRDEAEYVDYFCRTWAGPILHTALSLAVRRRDAQLTKSEWRVLELLASGHSYSEIAERLNRSVHTIDNQLRSARKKTGARNSIELLRRTGTGLR